MKHRAFKIETEHGTIVYVSTLRKAFLVSPAKASAIPDFVDSDEAPGESRQDKKLRYESATLLLTTGCNLRCDYCYEESAPEKTPIKMSSDIVDATISYLQRSATENHTDGIRLYFFGGEPTLEFDLLQYATKQLAHACDTAGIKQRTVITTNGVAQKRAVEWLCDNIDSITVSFDGPKYVQERHRGACFNKVFGTACTIYQHNPKMLNFRATVSDFSVMHLPDIVTFFGRHFPGTRLFLEPLFETGRAKNNPAASAPDPFTFFNSYSSSLDIADKYDLGLRTSISLNGAHSGRFCKASSSSLVVSPEGIVSSCPRMAIGDGLSNEVFRFGQIDGHMRIKIDGDRRKQLQSVNVDSIVACNDCFARYDCKGDCPANKAVLSPSTFATDTSYRCQAIKAFVTRLLLRELGH